MRALFWTVRPRPGPSAGPPGHELPLRHAEWPESGALATLVFLDITTSHGVRTVRRVFHERAFQRVLRQFDAKRASE